MVTLIKILIALVAPLFIAAINSNNLIESTRQSSAFYASSSLDNNYEGKAFDILENKCNVCHRKRNKKRIFTRGNMNIWSNDIYKQVFVKKRMPKGNGIRPSKT